MMAERPAPRFIVATIAFVQRRHVDLDAAMVATAASLAGMMAIGTLAAWIAG